MTTMIVLTRMAALTPATRPTGAPGEHAERFAASRERRSSPQSYRSASATAETSPKRVSLATCRLATFRQHRSPQAKNAQVIKLKSAVYNPAIDSVTLTPKKAFALTKPVQLEVDGVPPSGLQGSYGRLIGGGKNATALLGRRGATITAVRYTNTNGPQFLLESAAVDAVLEREGAIAFNHAARAGRRFRDEVAAIQ